MQSGHTVRGWKLLLALVMVLATVGMAVAQGQRPKRPARGQGRNQGAVPLQKARAEAGDALAKAADQVAGGDFHYTFRLRGFDGAPLVASYYPSKLGSSAPVVMLVHESGRSRKDFEDAVHELKGQGLAQHLQGLGYAVFSMDLRGQGQNPRRTLSYSERPRLLEDLQAAYFFLVDRHNRGDFNLAKLGVIALGDSANLVAAWAYQPGAALTVEGRPSDLSAMVLVSPKPEGYGLLLSRILAAVAPRVPLLLLAGDRDTPSRDAVQSVRQLVERVRLNRVELFPSSPLGGYKLLRLEPKVTSTIFRFLDTALRGRALEWEPRLNLTPVTYSDIQTVGHARPLEKLKNLPKDKDDAKKPADASKTGDAAKTKGQNPKPNALKNKDLPPSPTDGSKD
jgi:alpha-beta hydrolase superfamily lysophospholipase